MKCAIQFEDKVSRSRSKHEGESSASLCGKPIGRTRVSSQRQLPTDHDYAVPTREYQLDQSSPLPATAAADPVLDQKNDQRTLTGHYISGKDGRQTDLDSVNGCIGACSQQSQSLTSFQNLRSREVQSRQRRIETSDPRWTSANGHRHPNRLSGSLVACHRIEDRLAGFHAELHPPG